MAQKMFYVKLTPVHHWRLPDVGACWSDCWRLSKTTWPITDLGSEVARRPLVKAIRHIVLLNGNICCYDKNDLP